MRKMLCAVAVAAAAALPLTACQTTEQPQKVSGASPSTSSTDSKSSTPSTEETAEDASASDDTQSFGDGYKWDDGLKVVVSKPAPYKPSEYAAAQKGDKYFVQFTITITNGTDAAFDPSMFTASGSNADEEANEVFDSEKGMSGAPDTKILVGKSKKFKIAFGSAKKIGKEFVLEVSPSFEHDSVLFN